jgi:hypothetical protein
MPPHHLETLDHLSFDPYNRFDRVGGLADLEDSVLLRREVLELIPPSHPTRFVALKNLILGDVVGQAMVRTWT